MNCWNLSKLGAAWWFHLQLGSLEIDLNIYIYCSRLWPFGPLVRWSTTSSSSLAACIKLLPVLTSTRVEDYSSAAVPRRGSLHTAPFLISSMWSPFRTAFSNVAYMHVYPGTQSSRSANKESWSLYRTMTLSYSEDVRSSNSYSSYSEIFFRINFPAFRPQPLTAHIMTHMSAGEHF